MTKKEINSRLKQDARPTVTGPALVQVPGNMRLQWRVVDRPAQRTAEGVIAIRQGVRDLVRQGAVFWWQGDTIKVRLGEFSGSFDTSTHGAWYAFELMEAAWPNFVDYPEAYLSERYLTDILEWKRQGYDIKLGPCNGSKFFALAIRKAMQGTAIVGKFTPGPNLYKLRKFLEAIKIL